MSDFYFLLNSQAEDAYIKAMKLLSFIALSFVLSSNLMAQNDNILNRYERENPRSFNIVGWQLGFQARDYFGSSVGGMRLGARGSWWHQYFGFDVSTSFSVDDIEAGNTQIVDETFFQLSAGGLAGYQISNFKPYARLGIALTKFDYQAGSTNVETFSFQFEPGIGLQWVLLRHLVLGLDVLAIPITITGDVEAGALDEDIDGFGLKVLPGFSISYLF